MFRRSLAFGLAFVLLLALAVPADAVLSGRNGRIAFTSGREAANDNTAQIFWINPVSPILGAEGPFSIAMTQNRHATWSPDRTKLAFAAGTPGTLATEEYDIFVRDFSAEPDTITALNALQVGDNLSSDHPAWSPDGTRIAYEHQPADNSTDRDIYVQTVNTLQPPVALTTDTNTFDLKAAWSPDSQTIFFARSPKPTGDALEQFDIVKKGATDSVATPPTPVLTDATKSEYQPSISPDGTKLCYTRQTPQMQGTADIYVADLPGGGNQRDISDDLAKGDINCTWSPDGTKIAFSNGIFGTARLMVENANDADTDPAVNQLTDDMGSNNFDGNADWAPDGSPDCPDTAVTTPQNTPITINLECTDTGPEYERTDPNGFIANDGGPKNGTTSDDAPTSNPSTVKYTPNAGFSGTDTITYTSFDAYGFGTDKGTVTINVKAPGGGGGGPTATDTTAATISSVAVSPSRWRRSSSLAVFSLAPVGTTIRFRLNEDANVTLTFARATAGRRVGSRCVRPTRANRTRRKCTRYLNKGTLTKSLKAGPRRVKFRGQLTRTKRLGLGRYRLTIGAVDKAGNKSRSRTAFFTIVRR